MHWRSMNNTRKATAFDPLNAESEMTVRVSRTLFFMQRECYFCMRSMIADLCVRITAEQTNCVVGIRMLYNLCHFECR